MRRHGKHWPKNCIIPKIPDVGSKMCCKICFVPMQPHKTPQLLLATCDNRSAATISYYLSRFCPYLRCRPARNPFLKCIQFFLKMKKTDLPKTFWEITCSKMRLQPTFWSRDRQTCIIFWPMLLHGVSWISNDLNSGGYGGGTYVRNDLQSVYRSSDWSSLIADGTFLYITLSSNQF